MAKRMNRGGWRERMDLQIERLLRLMDQAIVQLRQRNEDYWADWFETSRAQIAASDFHGIKHLLGAYGGSGSLTDAFRDPKIEELLNTIWLLANQLRREEELATRENPS